MKSFDTFDAVQGAPSLQYSANVPHIKMAAVLVVKSGAVVDFPNIAASEASSWLAAKETRCRRNRVRLHPSRPVRAGGSGLPDSSPAAVALTYISITSDGTD